MSGQPAQTSHLRVADPEGLVGAIRGGDLEPMVLGGHGRESALSRVMLPGSCLDHAEIGPSMWFRGAMPTDCYTMVYVMACPEEGHSFNFNSRHRDRCLGLFAPGEALEATTPAGYRQATLTIHRKTFLEAAERLYPEIPGNLFARGRAIFPRHDVCRAASGLLAATAETLRWEPDTLAHGSALGALENELHEHFFDLLRHDQGEGGSPLNPGMTRRYQRLNRVREFVREHGHRRILLSELCAVSGLSRRGLEYLFQDLLGVRVSVFLLQSRLHGVRRELLAAPPAHGQVKECALNWGFWHLGRFASEYHALFGERPSDTLGRNRSS